MWFTTVRYVLVLILVINNYCQAQKDEKEDEALRLVAKASTKFARNLYNVSPASFNHCINVLSVK